MVNFYLKENHFVFELNNENNELQRFYTPEYFEFLGIKIEILSNNISKMNGGGYFQDGSELTIPYKYFANFIDGNMGFQKDTKQGLEQIEPEQSYTLVEESGTPTFKDENILSNVENDTIEKSESIELLEQDPLSENLVEELVEEEPVVEELVEEEPVEEEPVEEEPVEEEPVEKEPVEEGLPVEEGPVEEEQVEEEPAEEEQVEEEPAEEEPAEENTVVEDDPYVNSIVLENEASPVKNILMLKIEIDDENKTFNGVLKDIMTSNKEEDADNIQLNTDGLFYEDIERIYTIKNYLNIDVYQCDVFRINGKFIIIKENTTEPTENNISKLDVSMMNNTNLTNKLRI